MCIATLVLTILLLKLQRVTMLGQPHVLSAHYFAGKSSPRSSDGRTGLASPILVPRKLLMLYIYRQSSRDLPLLCQKYNLLGWAGEKWNEWQSSWKEGNLQNSHSRQNGQNIRERAHLAKKRWFLSSTCPQLASWARTRGSSFPSFLLPN